MTTTQKLIKIGAISLALVIIFNICSIIFGLFTSIANMFYDNNAEKITFNETYDNFNKLEIDALSSSITIKTGTEFKVEANNINKGFKTKLKNNTLELEETKPFLSVNDTTGEITITIKENTILEELSINTGTGKFTIDNIEIKELDIDHGAGNLEINNSYIHESDIDGGAGTIKITNTTINDLDLDSGVGKVDIQAKLTGTNQISCGVGNVDITILGDEDDYNINVNKGVGTIKINGTNQSNDTTYGNGKNKVQIDGGIGNINIKFE